MLQYCLWKFIILIGFNFFSFIWLGLSQEWELLEYDAFPLIGNDLSYKIAQNRFNPPGTFGIENDFFYLDGEPFQLYAAELHYFRVHPGYWQDRLERIHKLGFNAVQTYVPWNLHEPYPGVYNFEGVADLLSFLQAAMDAKLFVSLRPGPYICAEWDLGGLPWWLLKDDPPIRLRSNDERFMEPVRRWFNTLLPLVLPFLYRNGGPIIMLQIENEYGVFGDALNNPEDRAYLENLVALVRTNLGEPLVLFTVDWQGLENMQKGSLNTSDVLTTGDFGPKELPYTSWKNADEMNPPGMRVKFNPELYAGWLTHWNQGRHNYSSMETATSIIKQLSEDGSIALYVTHGGTNFGFWAGANGNETFYHSVLTSYDYNAPISENGDANIGSDGLSKVVGLKLAFYAMHYPVLWRHFLKFQKKCLRGESFPGRCDPSPLLRLREWIDDWPEAPQAESLRSTMEMDEVANLLENLDSLSTGGAHFLEEVKSMEQLGQGMGFILYQKEVRLTNRDGHHLLFEDIHDNAQVFINDKLVCSLPRDLEHKSCHLPKSHTGTVDEGALLNILVENMGRINFNSSFIFDRKGLLGSIWLDQIGNELRNWKAFLLPLETSSLENLHFKKVTQDYRSCSERDLDCALQLHLLPGPAFYRHFFSVSENPKDTFLYLGCWTRGVVWINGFNIGRFNAGGEQQTLFIPKYLLDHRIRNEIVILELYNTFASEKMPIIEFQNRPQYYQTNSSSEYEAICRDRFFRILSL